MSVVVRIAFFVLNIIFAILKLLPVQNKVVYISRQMDVTPLDFALLARKMEELHPEYENVILAKMLKGGIRAKVGYVFHMFRQMYHIATAKVVVLDTYCIAISMLKQRKGLLVIQMWHALGALKKFGYSILDCEEGTSSEMAHLMKMHNNYSYVFTSNEFCRPYFAEAFNIALEKVRVFPLPKLDLLADKENKEKTCRAIYEMYPRLKETEKKIIVYCPTFRKEGDLLEGVKKLVETVDYEKYELVIKFHPIMEEKFEDSRVIVDRKFLSSDMLFIADYVITDYSAIIFEAMALEKRLYLYAFDYKEYHKNRDFYMNYECDFKDILYFQAEELIDSIEKREYDFAAMNRLKGQMIAESDETYTSDICKFIIDNCKY